MRNLKGRLFGAQALWDLMMGSLLGIVSAGSLLVTQPSTTALLLAAPTAWLSKLEFLVLAGLCCGCGAAATGVVLLVDR
jgi:hypothetical protein